MKHMCMNHLCLLPIVKICFYACQRRLTIVEKCHNASQGLPTWSNDHCWRLHIDMVEFDENKWTPPQKFKSTIDFISNLNFTDFNLSWAAGKTMYFGHCIYPTLIRNINMFRSLFDKVIISSQPLFFLSPSDSPSHCWASRPSTCKEIITLWASYKT